MIDKKVILAIVLSVAVWGVYIVVMPKQKIVKKDKITNTTTKDSNKADQKVAKNKPIVVPQSFTPVSDRYAVKGRDEVLNLETEMYKVKLATKGAAIKSIYYKDRKIECVVKKNPKDYKIKKNMDFAIHFSKEEFLEGNGLDTMLWSYKKDNKGSITFFVDIKISGQPVRVEKKYTFIKKKNEFQVSFALTNRGRENITLPRGKIIISPSDIVGPELDFTNTYNTMTGAYGLKGDFETLTKGSGFMSKKGIIEEVDGNIEYAGIAGRYLLLLMIPENFKISKAYFDNREKTGYRTGVEIPVRMLEKRTTLNRSFKVYLGEKEKDKLIAVSSILEPAKDVNMFIEPIRMLVVWSLKNLHKLFGNLGLALVIFSIVTKLIFLPLTIKSTESMKKMQEIAPETEKLKKKIKDPQKQQQAIMAMYKEKGVNPLGGCLPMLLQMPFFFALYSALLNSVDLWNAPFIFWIKDLSMPDTVATLFGYNLNILPILMTATQFAQTKMTTVETGQQQKLMNMFLPVFILFIFWNMPSGLTLYWTLQNLLQVGHQLYVNSKGKKKEA